MLCTIDVTMQNEFFKKWHTCRCFGEKNIKKANQN